MKNRILAVVLGVALAAGAGFGAASLASASAASGGLYVQRTDKNHVTHWYASDPGGAYYAVTVPAGTAVVVPAPVTATDPGAGETAATLAQDASVVLTDTTVPLKWTGATPPLGATIDHYAVRQRLLSATSAAWSTVVTSTKVPHAVIASLAAYTAYDFQVQAVYPTGVGPWSNTVSVTTRAA